MAGGVVGQGPAGVKHTGHVFEMASPIESATHAEIVQVVESWDQNTGALHIWVGSYGTLDANGNYVANEMLRRGRIVILPDEMPDFISFQQTDRGVPAEVATSGNWRRDDVLAFVDARGLWQRLQL